MLFSRLAPVVVLGLLSFPAAALSLLELELPTSLGPARAASRPPFSALGATGLPTAGLGPLLVVGLHGAAICVLRN